ncbi:hypothetical protein BN946_scf184670.g3 [Trametes cinnabarina]|uniref:Uncharacterized protein n=1 Tax=Pycnoporus cinnabarinus TaxID=5643 RepID=A0A060T0C8_PYCCI|nr:hypothetical protein BN946_scf184670.g3 [Trametes cinnabarina]
MISDYHYGQISISKYRAVDSQFKHPDFLLYAYDIATKQESAPSEATPIINALIDHARLASRIAWELDQQGGQVGPQGINRLSADMRASFATLLEQLGGFETHPPGDSATSGMLHDSLAAHLQDSLAQQLREPITADLEDALAPRLEASIARRLQHSLEKRLFDLLVQTLTPRITADLQGNLIGPLESALKAPLTQALTTPVAEALGRRIPVHPRYSKAPTGPDHLSMPRREPSPLSALSGFKGPVLYPLIDTSGTPILDVQPSAGRRMTKKTNRTAEVTHRSLGGNGAEDFAEGNSRGEKRKRSF